MMVTFISQCEKKALAKTRRVLDAFAVRIGERTWQTLITQEGLNTVRQMLRQKASKNTSVACHWVRGKRKSELVWVVGNRNSFNEEGVFAVNYTEKQFVGNEYEKDWLYLPLIRSLTALAALFHDWGKASLCFQKKLKSKGNVADPLRHEWISCLLLKSLMDGCSADSEWLEKIQGDTFEEETLKKKMSALNGEEYLGKTPQGATIILWLVLSHHRLPNFGESAKGVVRSNFVELMEEVNAELGYKNRGEDFQKKVKECFDFPSGLMRESQIWIKNVKRWGRRLQEELPRLEQAVSDGSWRVIVRHARLALMLGDHNYSSQGADANWKGLDSLYANTCDGELKQKLDEHLVGVTKSALDVVNLLPQIEQRLPKAEDIQSLKQKSRGLFRWQDKGVEKIVNWKKEHEQNKSEKQQGFFAVNMASTGCGKTIANAKFMQALTKNENELRCVVALGLRSLTLQTGREYKERVGLDSSELATLIGSKSFQELYERSSSSIFESRGSESEESLLVEEIDFDWSPYESRLSTVLKDTRARKFLEAPVLVCTIDQIISATEATRGGRYILPWLRLMSSDLVIDEVDDFSNQDFYALGRIVQLVGLLGRKVLISSATMTPGQAEGLFNMYKEGWSLYSQTRNVSSQIGCGWFDEFGVYVDTVLSSKKSDRSYAENHEKFSKKRVQKIRAKEEKEGVKRKGKVIPCEELLGKKDFEQGYFSKIQKEAVQMHTKHHTVDSQTGKKISFGVVRMAHVDPCIRLTQFLAQAEWAEESEIRVMAYHSRQILLLRSEQEKHLDEVLKRKEQKGEEPKAFNHSIIRKHIDKCTSNNLIFILVVTPVEEVGRDHDFDWAIVEPSSYRSIIQLAGRVLRHRDLFVKEPNVGIMQYNLWGIKKKDSVVYCFPGYEDSNHRLSTHDAKALLDGVGYEESINAIPRVLRKKELSYKDSLVDLEHFVIEEILLNEQSVGPSSFQGWAKEAWWMSGTSQKLCPFRKREHYEDVCISLVIDDDGMNFKMRDFDGRWEKVEGKFGIERESLSKLRKDRLWLERDYERLLWEIAEEKKISLEKASQCFGELRFSKYKQRENYLYSDQFGLRKIERE